MLAAVVGCLCAGISCRGTESSLTQGTPQAGSSPAVATTPSPTASAAADIPQEQHDRTVYDGPLDAASRLLITETQTSKGGRCCSTVLRVSLIDRADAARRSEIDTIPDDYEYSYEVKRLDPSAAVLCRTDSHWMDGGCFKLFIDPVARRLVRRFDFSLQQDVAFESDVTAQHLLGVTAKDLDALRSEDVFRSKPRESRELPPSLTAHPLPPSTFEEFARARPARVKNGYGKDTKFEETIGAWQADQGGFWVTRTFYDGEGTSGVGVAGFLSSTGQYSFLTIPELFDWSVDAVLVEPDALWAGRVMHGEGPDNSGGLLRYDRQTRTSEVEKVPGVILRIAHLGDAVFLGTTRGLYVSRNGTVTWHHMEPDASGKLVVVTETLTK